MYTHIFIQATERWQSRLGLQKVDSKADAKGLALGQLDTYSWQNCQGIRQSSISLEKTPEVVSKQRSIMFLFYVHTHFHSGPREKAEQAGFATG
jgi:hypothetical protein